MNGSLMLDDDGKTRVDVQERPMTDEEILAMVKLDRFRGTSEERMPDKKVLWDVVAKAQGYNDASAWGEEYEGSVHPEDETITIKNKSTGVAVTRGMTDDEVEVLDHIRVTIDELNDESITLSSGLWDMVAAGFGYADADAVHNSGRAMWTDRTMWTVTIFREVEKEGMN